MNKITFAIPLVVSRAGTVDGYVHRTSEGEQTEDTSLCYDSIPTEEEAEGTARVDVAVELDLDEIFAGRSVVGKPTTCTASSTRR